MAKAATIATRSTILSELNESIESLHAKGIDADTLVAIYHNYLARLPELEEIAGQVMHKLQKTEGVHALTHRLKDPLHLLQKIIRKKKEYPDRDLHPTNYLDYINDLIGIRVLHLYEADWQTIGKYIEQVWHLKREPYAYINQFCTTEHLHQLAKVNYRIIRHPAGYRAVHFVIATRPYKQRYYTEIQLRTLFEEAWSEIDHRFRYPNHAHSALMDDLLHLLNIFTSNADETALQIQKLNDALDKPTSAQQTIARLHRFIASLPIPTSTKQHLHSRINKVL